MATTPNLGFTVIDSSPAKAHDLIPQLRDFQFEVDDILAGAVTGPSFLTTGAAWNATDVLTGEPTGEHLSSGYDAAGNIAYIRSVNSGTAFTDLHLAGLKTSLWSASGAGDVVKTLEASGGQLFTREAGAAGVATVNNFRCLMDLTEVSNNVKNGLNVNIQTTSSTGTIVTNGIAVYIYTPPDNGGDVSGIHVNQTGGGNAGSFFHFSNDRPGGFTDYRNNGYAIESAADGNAPCILAQPGSGPGLRVYLGRTVDDTVGIGVQVRPTADANPDRYAYHIIDSTGLITKFYATLDGRIYTAGNLGIGTAATEPMRIGGTHIGVNGGDSAVAILRCDATINGQISDDVYALKWEPTLTKAASGIHEYFIGANFQAPIISGGAATVLQAATVYIAGQPTGASENYAIWVDSGLSRFDGSIAIGANSAEAKLRIDVDSTVGNQTHINLTDAVNVAHGITTLHPTSAFGAFQNAGASGGGMLVRGLSDADVTALKLDGMIGLTGAVTAPAVLIRGFKKTGTTFTALGAAETVFAVSNSTGTPSLTVLGNGNVNVLGRVHSLLTTEQLRLSYDAPNYAAFTVGNTGSLAVSSVNNMTFATQAGTARTIELVTESNAAGFAIARLLLSASSTAGVSQAHAKFWSDGGNFIGLLIGDTGLPAAKLHVLATTQQLRLGYDAANYVSFTTSSGGDLTVTPTGGEMNLAANVGIGTSTFGTSAVRNFALANGTAPSSSRPAGVAWAWAETHAYYGSVTDTQLVFDSKSAHFRGRVSIKDGIVDSWDGVPNNSITTFNVEEVYTGALTSQGKQAGGRFYLTLNPTTDQADAAAWPSSGAESYAVFGYHDARGTHKYNQIYGAQFTSVFTASDTLKTSFGVLGDTQLAGAGTCSENMNGLFGQFRTSGAGGTVTGFARGAAGHVEVTHNVTITAIRSLYASLKITDGVHGSAAMVHSTTPTITGGSVGNLYGVRIEDMSSFVAYGTGGLWNIKSFGVNSSNVFEGAVLLGGSNPITDAAPNLGTLQGQNAYAQATTNTTGGDIMIAGGIGRRLLTSILNSAGGFTITITTNGTAVSLVSSTNFNLGTDDTAPQLAVTATNLAAAINAHSTLKLKIKAVASTDKIYIEDRGPCYSLIISSSQPARMSTTAGTDGNLLIGATKVGLATTTPTSVFQISGTSTAFSAGDPSIFRINASMTALNNGDIYAFKYDPTFITHTSGTHTYFLSMNIQPPTITYNGAAVTNAATVFIGDAPTGAATNKYALWVGGGSVRLAVLGSGAVQSDANGVLSVTSDARQKIRIADFDLGINALMGLKPAQIFKWKNDGSGRDCDGEYVSWFAQDVQPFIPHAVGGSFETHYTLSDRPILAATVNAVVDHENRIKELSQQVTKLKKQIAEMSSH